MKLSQSLVVAVIIVTFVAGTAAIADKNGKSKGRSSDGKSAGGAGLNPGSIGGAATRNTFLVNQDQKKRALQRNFTTSASFVSRDGSAMQTRAQVTHIIDTAGAFRDDTDKGAPHLARIFIEKERITHVSGKVKEETREQAIGRFIQEEVNKVPGHILDKKLVMGKFDTLHGIATAAYGDKHLALEITTALMLRANDLDDLDVMIAFMTKNYNKLDDVIGEELRVTLVTLEGIKNLAFNYRDAFEQVVEMGNSRDDAHKFAFEMEKGTVLEAIKSSLASEDSALLARLTRGDKQAEEEALKKFYDGCAGGRHS